MTLYTSPPILRLVYNPTIPQCQSVPACRLHPRSIWPSIRLHSYTFTCCYAIAHARQWRSRANVTLARTIVYMYTSVKATIRPEFARRIWRRGPHAAAENKALARHKRLGMRVTPSALRDCQALYSLTAHNFRPSGICGQTLTMQNAMTPGLGTVCDGTIID